MKRGFDLTSQYPCNCLLVTIAADFLNDIKSGSIGINITRNQDTASALVPTINQGRETALPCPLYNSGAARIDMTRRGLCPQTKTGQLQSYPEIPTLDLRQI